MKIDRYSWGWKQQKSEIICFFMKTFFIKFGIGRGQDLRDDHTMVCDSAFHSVSGTEKKYKF